MDGVRVESVIFEGIEYRRYPDSERRSDRVYFKPSEKFIRQGYNYLHREIWKKYNGAIPKGCHIHHKDENPLNNDIANLECKQGNDHISDHMREILKENPDFNRKGLEKAREKAPEWHHSEEGRKWHKEHPPKIEFVLRVCKQCGAEFYGRVDAEYCSKNCISKQRRDSGIDNEIRQCARCGKDFTVNKYSRTLLCARSCDGRRI